MIPVHLGVSAISFHNEEVEINSLDQHPTESGHQEILHQSCYGNTGSLWKERVFVFLSCSFRQDIFGVKCKFILWIEGEDTNFVFYGVYSGEEDDLSSSKGDRNTSVEFEREADGHLWWNNNKLNRMNETKVTTTKTTTHWRQQAQPNTIKLN